MGPELETIVGEAPLVICVVATECCVLSTVLAGADACRRVTVFADDYAGATEGQHGQTLAVIERHAPLVRVVTSAKV